MKLRRVFKRAGALLMAGLIVGIPAVAAGVGVSESIVAYAETGSQETEQVQPVITVSDNEVPDHRDNPEDVKNDDPEDAGKEEPGTEEPGAEDPGSDDSKPEEPGPEDPGVTPTPTPAPEEPEPEPVCICKSRCSRDHVNEE